MESSAEEIQTQDPAEKIRIPYLTLLVSLICLVIWVGINTEPLPLSQESLKKWGGSDIYDILKGEIQGIITAAFFHIEVWVIALNVYAFVWFGKKVELTEGLAFYFIFLLSSIIFCSISEMAFGDQIGSGIAGVCFSLLTYIVVKSKNDDRYQGTLSKITVYVCFLGLLFCIITTISGKHVFAIYSASGGIFWGALVAYSSQLNKALQVLLYAVSVSLVSLLIFYNPYNVSWISHKAYELHNEETIDQAFALYKEILVRDPDNDWALEQFNDIKYYQLSNKAYELHSSDKLTEAVEVYKDILQLKPDDEWAASQLQLIEDSIQ